jgi:hypothetical protein
VTSNPITVDLGEIRLSAAPDFVAPGLPLVLELATALPPKQWVLIGGHARPSPAQLRTGAEHGRQDSLGSC